MLIVYQGGDDGRGYRNMCKIAGEIETPSRSLVYRTVIINNRTTGKFGATGPCPTSIQYKFP
jgi:hypothetical protein